MLLPGPALGIRFEIDKADSNAYGLECWKVFWRVVNPTKLAGSLLYEGDTAATLAGSENVFCIAVQKDDRAVLDEVRAKLEQSADFQRMAASASFVGEDELASEPLPEAGRIGIGGKLEGGLWSKSALDAVRGGGSVSLGESDHGENSS